MWISLMGALGAVLGGLVIAYTYVRANTPRVWQETAEGYRLRAEQLEADNRKLVKRVTALEAEMLVLKAKTDLSAVKQELVETKQLVLDLRAIIVDLRQLTSK